MGMVQNAEEKRKKAGVATASCRLPKPDPCMGGAAISTPYKQYLYMLVQCSQMHAVLPGPYICYW